MDDEVIVREVLEVRDRSRALAEERDQLHKWIVDLEPWGDFELPDWAREGDLRFWFYIVPLYQMERMTAVDLPWKVVARDHRFAYVVVMASDQPTGMPVPRWISSYARSRSSASVWSRSSATWKNSTIHASA